MAVPTQAAAAPFPIMLPALKGAALAHLNGDDWHVQLMFQGGGMTTLAIAAARFWLAELGPLVDLHDDPNKFAADCPASIQATVDEEG